MENNGQPPNDGLGSKRSPRRMRANYRSAEVLRLRADEGLTHAEIAGQLGISERRVAQIEDKHMAAWDETVRKHRPRVRAQCLSSYELIERQVRPLALQGDLKAIEVWMKALDGKRGLVAADLPAEKVESRSVHFHVTTRGGRSRGSEDPIEGEFSELPPPALEAGEG